MGFNNLVQAVGSNIETMYKVIYHLMYNGFITKKSGPNNIMILELTEKGVKIARLLKELAEALDEP